MSQRPSRPSASGEPPALPRQSAVEAGVRIRVRAVPGAGRDAVIGRHGEAFRVAVRAAPERGKANEAVCGVVAAAAGVPRRHVEIVSGHGGRDKVLLVRGVGSEDVLRRIEGAADGTGIRR